MLMHETGTQAAPAVMLIHGAMQPWQVLLPIANALADRYHVLIPSLGGHSEEAETPFDSIDREADKLADWLARRGIHRLHAVCGLSMGGAVAYALWTGQRIAIDRLVLDGAPLVPAGRLLTSMMTSSYLSILRGAKARDQKTLRNFEKNFLPKSYLVPFLRIADNLGEQSMRNMVASVGASRLHADMPQETRVLYMHGTKLPGEMLSRMSAKHLRKVRPQTKIIALRGRGHCELAAYAPERWLETVRPFIDT